MSKFVILFFQLLAGYMLSSVSKREKGKKKKKNSKMKSIGKWKFGVLEYWGLK